MTGLAIFQEFLNSLFDGDQAVDWLLVWKQTLIFEIGPLLGRPPMNGYRAIPERSLIGVAFKIDGTTAFVATDGPSSDEGPRPAWLSADPTTAVQFGNLWNPYAREKRTKRMVARTSPKRY